MSGTDFTIVDTEGEAASAPGRDRRGAMALAFVLCLAVGSAGVGRDGPAATAPVDSPWTVVLSQHGDFVLFTAPGRLANEPVRTEWLLVNTGDITPPADIKWVSGPVEDRPVLRGWLIDQRGAYVGR